MLSTVLIVILLVSMGNAHPCPDGSFSSPITPTKCFNFTVSKASFFLAFESCKEMPNSSLAVISNIFENAALRAYALNYDDEPYAWIGLNDVAENGQWSWINGHNAIFSRWAVGYPKSEPNALCVAMNTMTGFWQNKDCANRLPFFCSIDSISFPRGGNGTRRYEGLLEVTTKETDDLLDELSALDRANRNETK